MNIVFRSGDLDALTGMFERAVNVFRVSGFRVQTLSLQDIALAQTEADVVIVREVDEHDLKKHSAALIALMDTESVVVVAVADPYTEHVAELAAGEDVRQWQLTERNEARMPISLVAHVCMMIVHGDDWWERDEGSQPDLAPYIAARLERDGEMLPPWIEHPEFPRYGVDWRKGVGENHLMALHEWVHAMSGEDRLAYVKSHAPVPVSWVGWAATVLFPFQEQQSQDAAVKLVEEEGLADYSAWQRWESGEI